MKIVAIGGAGAVGTAALRAVMAMSGSHEIVVADRNPDAARTCARRLDAAPLTVDATDSRTLRAALDDADIVLNTAGPFYRLGPLVLRAAIDTRTHYLDVCDDWEPTLGMLEFDAMAKESGITAVLGMGASPGLSNLMAAQGAAELDTVDQLYTVWPVDPPGYVAEDAAELLTAADGRPSAAALHWLQQLSGTILVVRGGRRVTQRPMHPIRLRLPGRRSGTVYTVGHPEPITLACTVAPGADIACAMLLKRSTVAFLDDLRNRIDKGHSTIEEAATRLIRPGLLMMARAVLRAPAWPGPGNLPPFFAVACGTTAGAPSTVVVTPHRSLHGLFGDMARATGIPLALGAAQVCGGAARTPGVHPPEAIIDRKAFFAAFAQYCGGERSVTVARG
ncbi:saccharopine dehydrogenase [Mycolicibacterium sp. CH28]|uniref:saccharopine dehydrogenase family protein n=1 Tax=Mycolicibacterium sp. CH28 TaxID=2512237 RepID=UPI0010814952|nr:saccharopine dehydrogenase NADP-binding domain-containing protein [Mycolicibacterium sp. CH28]TGD84503.1 saccharopine dehydrogenase [Mycolicibacterium sp. CH28]